jgi:hypothetical protein
MNEKHTINTEVLLFLEKSLRKAVSSFIPPREIPLLPPGYLEFGSHVVFYDYFFAIEKFLNTHIIPDYYSPLYSSKMLHFLKDDSLKRKIQRIVKYFETADKSINDKSVNILPRSAYHYFKDTFGGRKSRYAIDYVCDAYSIRHAHLTTPNDDCLLFYALVNNNILLLNIGTHKEIYDNNNLRILITEFPEYLEPLGIHELTGIDPGIEQTWEGTKQMWGKNVSLSPVIDGKTYSTAFRSLSGISLDVVRIFQEISFQINTASVKIIKSLEKDYSLYVKKSKSKLALKYGYVFIGDRVSNNEWSIHLEYFEKYRLIEMILNNSLS